MADTDRLNQTFVNALEFVKNHQTPHDDGEVQAAIEAFKELAYDSQFQEKYRKKYMEKLAIINSIKYGTKLAEEANAKQKEDDLSIQQPQPPKTRSTLEWFLNMIGASK